MRLIFCYTKILRIIFLVSYRDTSVGIVDEDGNIIIEPVFKDYDVKSVGKTDVYIFYDFNGLLHLYNCNENTLLTNCFTHIGEGYEYNSVIFFYCRIAWFVWSNRYLWKLFIAFRV